MNNKTICKYTFVHSLLISIAKSAVILRNWTTFPLLPQIFFFFVATPNPKSASITILGPVHTKDNNYNHKDVYF